MSNNYWQPQNNHNSTENQPRKSGLLSNYGSPPANRPVTQGPPPTSPFPPAPNQVNRPMGQPSQQLPPPQQQWNGPTFMARPAQMVQRISAKMAAMRRPNQPVDPNPMVRYRGHQSPTPFTAPQAPTQPTPWRRSRTQRITHLRKKRLERWRNGGPGSKRLSTILLSVIAALLIIVVTSTTSYAYNFYQSELPQIQHLADLQSIPQTTHIYDRHGVLLNTLYENKKPGEGGRGTLVSYNYLPAVLQDAQIAAEDPTFWDNDGIDPQGVLRALTQLASSGGQPQSGGSTLTQQLIKNLSHNAQDTLQRKASEAALAVGLTQQYPKWKILEMYFNVTPYGAQDQGVEAAVEDYFGIQPHCVKFQCTPAVAYLDRDLTKCSKPGDVTTCASDPILALTRAALLAGIPQNPTHNDPTVNDLTYQHVMTVRLPYVLGQMKANGMIINLGLGDPTLHKIDKGPITDEIIAQVEKMANDMKIVGFRQTQLAPHFVQWVIRTLSNALGNYQNLDLNGISIPGYQLLLTGGFNIYTTLDLNLEQFVEKDIKHNLRDQVCQPYTGCGPLNTVWNVNDSAAVVMDAKTGEVLAMDGSADFKDKSKAVSGQYNSALAYRQPGSSLKPIIYAAAFEKGWYPGIKLIDGKTFFPYDLPTPQNGHTYTPTDYQKSYHPNLPTNIRISLANSFNIPAIKALMYAGLDNVADMARRLGITAIDRDLAVDWHGNTLTQAYGASFALGTAGIPLLQMVGAYQTFANNGVRVPAHNILDIWDNYGHDLYHYDPAHPNGAQVLSPQIAFMLNSMLSDNQARHFEFTGISTLTMGPWSPDRPVAAKTGTTDSFVDNWTIGYSSSLVVGVWSGNADGNRNPMREGVIGISGAGPIWHDIITYASGHCQLGMCPSKAYPTNPFTVPPGVVQASVNTFNGLQGSGYTDWMLENEQPQQSGMPVCTPNPDPTQNPNPTNPCPSTGSGKGNGNGNGNGNSDIFGDNPFDY